MQEVHNHQRTIEQLRSELNLQRTQIDQARQHAEVEAEAASVSPQKPTFKLCDALV